MTLSAIWKQGAWRFDCADSDLQRSPTLVKVHGPRLARYFGVYVWADAVASWLQSLEHLLQATRFPPVYAKCLHHFVGVLQRLQPYLMSWTKDARLPRTNNDLNALFGRSKRAIAASADARTGMPICCAMGGERLSTRTQCSIWMLHTRSSTASAPSPQTVGSTPAVSSARLSTEFRRGSASSISELAPCNSWNSAGLKRAHVRDYCPDG